MKVVVMGAGAVGAYFGGRLAGAGHAVTLVARGDHLRALQSRGLTLRSTLGDLHLEPVTAVEDAEVTGPADLVLFTVKAQDSEAAIERIAPLVAHGGRVLTLQNGVDGVEMLQRAFGDERVLAGVAYIEAVITAPGEITHKSPFARVVFGPLAGPDARADAVEEAFREAGVEARQVLEPKVEVWRKWLLICAFSGLTALTRMPIGSVLAREETRSMLRSAMQEIAELAAAAGVALPAEAVDDAMKLVRETFQPSMTSSLAQDLAAGKRLELEALNGAASRLGRRLNVATPTNDAIYAALVLHADGQG